MKKKNARERLIESAFELFSENGYAATTTKELADLAEVNEVTLFRLFTSKEQLFSEMINHYADIEMISKLVYPGRSGELRKDLQKMCQNMLSTITVRNKLIRLLMSHAPDNPIIKKKLATFPKGLLVFITEYLREIVPKDQHKGKDFEMAAMILLSYFLRFSMTSSLLGKDPLKANSKKNIDRFLDSFLYGFLNDVKLHGGE